MNNFTPRAQQVLAHARREADRFNHHYIGTEHLLLGLLKLGKGVAVTCAWLMLYLPVTGVLCCLAGGVAVMLTGYLPVGAVLIAALAVPVGWLQYGTEAGAVLALNAVIMVTRHWAGLQRIHRGEELQFFRPKL